MNRNEYQEFTFAREIKLRPKHKPSRFNFKTIVKFSFYFAIGFVVANEMWSRLL